MNLTATQRRVFNQAVTPQSKITPKALFKALKGVEGMEHTKLPDSCLVAMEYTSNSGMKHQFTVSSGLPKGVSSRRGCMVDAVTTDKGAKQAIRVILRDHGCVK